MSGTSLDGVDAALIETDGYDYVAPLDFFTLPYTDEQRLAIRPAFGLRNAGDPVAVRAAEVLTAAHIKAVKKLGAQADLIGFHGQTIYHAPHEGVSLQIGNAQRLARETGMDVVHDFRSADVRAGGQGAPLAPLYHAARLAAQNAEFPVVILNIGGVANVTYIDRDSILAFDTGPGNALMDDWVQSRTGQAFDYDGELAKKGHIQQDIIRAWLKDSYFDKAPPKSLDRDEWDIAALGPLVGCIEKLSTEDGAATLMEFTAQTIAQSPVYMPKAPQAWYVCGGGRHNTALKARLGELMSAPVRSVEDLGWNGDATEAECFAYLAVRSLLGEPVSLPTTTGVPEAMTGGTVERAD